MRSGSAYASIVLIVLLLLSACARDRDAPIDELIDPMDGSVDPVDEPIDEAPDADGFDPSEPDVLTTVSNVVNVSTNVTVNGSDPWIIGEDASGDPLIVEPRARLSESFLGVVHSDDPTPRIVSFTLIAQQLSRPIVGFENMTGTVRIDRERVPQRLAVRANYAGEVGSVLFSFEGNENHRVENAPPFALHGVDEFGRYAPWVPDLGQYVIAATPFDRREGIGPSREPVILVIEFYSPGYLDRVPNP